MKPHTMLHKQETAIMSIDCNKKLETERRAGVELGVRSVACREYGTRVGDN
jgi:hypothetical protein